MNDKISPASIDEKELKPEMFPMEAFENSGSSSSAPWIKLKTNSSTKIPEWEFYGLIPIGAILPWHKNLTGVPSLPANWMECDGSTVNDSESPLNGQTLPNLNGDGRFLRGSSTSGTEQTDAFQGHYHSMYIYAAGAPTSSMAATAGNTTDTNIDAFIRAKEAKNDGTHGDPRIASETRPINMSIVWIMRIK